MRYLRTLPALLVLAVAGCGGASASPATRPSTSASSRPITTFATASPRPSLATPEVQCLPQSWTGLMLLNGTDGSEIIWSMGRPGEKWAPDLYAFKPGDKQPTLIFENPNRNAQLNTVAVHNGRYAFEELATNKDGTGSWRLWYMASRSSKPVVLDSNAGDPQDLQIPGVWLALTDTQLTWNAVHMIGGKAMWSLKNRDFRTGVTRTLVQGQAFGTEYWFPDVDSRGRLLYSTAEYGPDKSYDNAVFHVYLADLADDPIKPVQLDKDGFAAEPVFAGEGDTVVWKSVERPFALHNWGQLYRYSLKTGELKALWFENETQLDYQTAGNRFVAAWPWHSNDFSIYDLQTDASIFIERYDPRGPEHVLRPVLDGDLLVFMRANNDLPGGKNKWLCYAKLPPLGA